MRKFLGRNTAIVALALIAVPFALLTAATHYANTRTGSEVQVLAPTAVAPHTCVTTDQYEQSAQATGAVWFFDSTTTATATIQRVDVSGVTHNQFAAVDGGVFGITANVELVQNPGFPLRLSQAKICNTTADGGTIQVDMNERR